MIPADLKYTQSHEWVSLSGDVATMGITDYAQSQLGDITYVELPAPGKQTTAGEAVAVVESVKAASDIYAPAAGEVSEVNESLEGSPEHINNDPYKEGWLLKISGVQPSDIDALMTADQYEKFLEVGAD